MSRKQKSIALSTAEAEYIAASMPCCEDTCSRKLLSELFIHVLDTTIILYDKSSGICQRISCSTIDPSILIFGTILSRIWYSEAS